MLASSIHEGIYAEQRTDGGAKGVTQHRHGVQNRRLNFGSSASTPLASWDSEKRKRPTRMGPGKAQKSRVVRLRVFLHNFAWKQRNLRPIERSRQRWALVIAVVMVFLLISITGQNATSFGRANSIGLTSRSDLLLPSWGLEDLRDFGYVVKPQQISLPNPSQAVVFDPFRIMLRRIEGVEEPSDEIDEEEEEWYDEYHTPLEDPDCVPFRHWQELSFPTCNLVHELNLGETTWSHDKGKNDDEEEEEEDEEELTEHESGVFINHGDYRDVWRIREFDGTRRVLKTLRFEHDFSYRDYQEHRRDALVMERLTGSPYVAETHSYCFTSGTYDFSSNGDLTEELWPDDHKSHFTRLDRLRVAVQVSGGIAAMHNIDGDGIAAVAHTDIAPDQYILLDGVYKLIDFNRCRFILWDEENHEKCGFRIDDAPGTFRSPEEYRYDVLTDKVDIYQLGNMFYALLTYTFAYDGYERWEAKEVILGGGRPPMPNHLLESEDPVHVALRTAIDMSQPLEPEERATATEISDFLSKELVALIKSGYDK